VNHLRREQAPVSTRVWEQVDAEVRRALTTYLTARRVVDFEGPHGYELSAVSTGRTSAEHTVPGAGVQVATRAVQPLVEVRCPFTVAWSEIEAMDRGATVVDLDAAVTAARSVATVEDTLVFEGFGAVGATGLVDGSDDDAILVGTDPTSLTDAVARACTMLRSRGVDGPYALVAGSRLYTDVIEASEDGYPVLRHLRMVLEGPVLWASALEGAVVLSTRGGDFTLVVGEDLSVGYARHDDSGVTFVLEETIAVRVDSPEAAVALRGDREHTPDR
jgi:uncharacterized linocin/CFP29 family protein